jgi:hypothetical protein
MDYSQYQPEWVKDFTQKYSQGIAHAYVIRDNVSDYVLPGVSLRQYICQMTARYRVVVIYNRAEGLIFPVENHRKEFVRILGLDASPQAMAMARAAGLGEGSGPNMSDPKIALNLLTQLLRTGQPEDRQAVVILEYPESLFPESGSSENDRTNLVLVQGWGRDPQIMASGNLAFMLTDEYETLAGGLKKASSRWETLSIPLPDYQQRLDYIEWYLEKASFDCELTGHYIAGASTFLQLIHIEDIFLRAEEEGTLTAPMIAERKAEIISSEFGDVIEIWEPTQSYADIGGLDTVKAFFEKSVIRPIHTGNLARVPKGVLMIGPAGTGKSVMAEAVAFEAGINAVQFNPAKFMDKYVGGTEQRLEKTIRALISMAPVIVFIDEIDQTFSRGESGDSGVSNRVFKRLLEVMADEKYRGKIIFLAATNRPDLIDPALKRPGRMDRKIAFFVPDETEREAIVGVMIERYIGTVDHLIPATVIGATDGWTGAELVELVRKAGEIMIDDGYNLDTALGQAAFRLCRTTQGIREMTALALQEINDLDLVPAAYQAQWIALRKSDPEPQASVQVERGKTKRSL